MTKSERFRTIISRSGMLLVLLLLAGFFSVATISDQPAEGRGGAAQLVPNLDAGGGKSLLLAAGSGPADQEFASEILAHAEGRFAVSVARDAAAARKALEGNPDRIIASAAAANWLVFDAVRDRIMAPRAYRFPSFLKLENLRNISSQISIIAILAAGMTMIILTSGIDLSVGSVAAVSAMATAWLVANVGGGKSAGVGSMLLAAAGGIGIGAAAGAINGSLVALCRVPSFIATLAMMQVARGLAFKIGNNQSISDIPDAFGALGRQFTLGLPNLTLLMIFLYLAAQVFMTRTVRGRHIYAVGANPRAAQFSGISLPKTRFLVFLTAGMLAGLAGVALCSHLLSGDPKYGEGYELQAIAAAVVGGTSLSGGRGAILGTLIGAFIIAVLENGLNMLKVQENERRIVIGLVILAAVLVDRFGPGRRRAEAQFIA